MQRRRSPRRRCSDCFKGMMVNDDGGNGYDDVRSERRDINDDEMDYKYL